MVTGKKGLLLVPGGFLYWCAPAAATLESLLA